VTITGFLWGLFSPTSLLLFFLILGLTLLLSRFRRTGLIVLSLTSTVLCAIALLPIGDGMVLALESRFRVPDPPPTGVDGIIVLGGASRTKLSQIHDRPVLNRDAQRLTTFATLARRYPQARLAYTGGGFDSKGDVREFEIARAMLAEIGVDTDRIEFEQQARTTYDNATLTKKLLKPGDGEIWLLVTSASHMPRAMGAFRAAGWRPVAYPTNYLTGKDLWAEVISFDLPGGLWLFERGSHEWIGLLVYWLLDRSNEIFPSDADPD
jgi:uncharacterized SAM-binding protein YcdF (DUF218 family)